MNLKSASASILIFIASPAAADDHPACDIARDALAALVETGGSLPVIAGNVAVLAVLHGADQMAATEVMALANERANLAVDRAEAIRARIAATCS